MMSDIVIRTENLGKKYIIGSNQQHRSFREALSAKARGISQKIMAPLGKRINNQEKEKEEFWALKDISFEVKKGEVVGIIGRNGAGKSTLLKILSRITEPTKGRIYIKGRVSSLLEVGTGFHPELTGRENIYLNGSILGMSKAEIEGKFDEIIEFSGIEKFIDTPVKRYSSGMYVRLAFAVAAYLEPEILIVDEVLAVGDYEFQKKCLGKMEKVASEGRTVLMVSHNMTSVVNLCQRGILLNSGKVVTDGRVTETVQKYMETAREAGGEVVWPDPKEAPGDEVLRLHAVRILQEGIEGATGDVEISKEVIIEISYWNLYEGALVSLSLWLRDQMGGVVLGSATHKGVSLIEDYWHWRPRPVGRYRTICRIPGNFLNEGMYSITFWVNGLKPEARIYQDYAVSFYVHDTGEMREQHGAFAGVVRPKLAWSTEYIEK